MKTLQHEMIFRCKWLGDGCSKLSEIADNLEEQATILREMEENGVYMKHPMQDDYAFFFVDDEKVAKRYQMHSYMWEENNEALVET